MQGPRRADAHTRAPAYTPFSAVVHLLRSSSSAAARRSLPPRTTDFSAMDDWLSNKALASSSTCEQHHWVRTWPSLHPHYCIHTLPAALPAPDTIVKHTPLLTRPQWKPREWTASCALPLQPTLQPPQGHAATATHLELTSSALRGVAMQKARWGSRPSG